MLEVSMDNRSKHVHYANEYYLCDQRDFLYDRCHLHAKEISLEIVLDYSLPKN